MAQKNFSSPGVRGTRKGIINHNPRVISACVISTALAIHRALIGFRFEKMLLLELVSDYQLKLVQVFG